MLIRRGQDSVGVFTHYFHFYNIQLSGPLGQKYTSRLTEDVQRHSIEESVTTYEPTHRLAPVPLEHCFRWPLTLLICFQHDETKVPSILNLKVVRRQDVFASPRRPIREEPRSLYMRRVGIPR